MGLLKTTKAGLRYILNVVYYFYRFVILFTTKDTNVESVL